MADELLLAAWRDAARDIAERAMRIGTEASYRRAYAQLSEIQDILDDLDDYSHRYIERMLNDVFKAADAKAIKLLATQKAGADIYSAFAVMNEQALKYVVDGTAGRLSAATQGVGQRADEFFRHTRLSATLDKAVQEQIGRGTVGGLSRQTLSHNIGKELQTEFTQGIVSIVGQDGKLYKYDADYYAQMVAHTGRRQAVTAATIMRTAQNGEDLVLFSTNFSLIQDFCDAFRGRVYSLSGTDPVAPPLASIPNGGPPLHPNCLHYLSPWVREFYSDAEYMTRAVTDPRFLNIDAREANKRWQRLGAFEQAQLRHAPDKVNEFAMTGAA